MDPQHVHEHVPEAPVQEGSGEQAPVLALWGVGVLGGEVVVRRKYTGTPAGTALAPALFPCWHGTCASTVSLLAQHSRQHCIPAGTARAPAGGRTT